MTPQYLDNLDQVLVMPIGDDDCLLDFRDQRVVLSYDAMYELALRLAELIHRAGDRPASRDMFS